MSVRKIGEHIYSVTVRNNGKKWTATVDMLRGECECAQFDVVGDCPHIREVEQATGWRRIKSNRDRERERERKR